MLLLINDSEPEETRAALVEDGRVVDYRCERAAAVSLVGNIYKGRVVNLERGIGAAFVDVGVGRNGFLHVSACADVDETTRIEDLYAIGDTALVQVTRESIGSKGPMLTGQLSLPGRFVVFLPGNEGGGISRHIVDADERSQLRALAKELEKRSGAGVILRTAAAHRTKRDLMRDLRTLRRLWDSIEAQARGARAPALLYAESDLVGRALRDMVDRKVEEIHVDTPEALERARETVRALQPELLDRLRLHAGGDPLFHAFGIEAQIDRLRVRRVPLPGGGSVVFDRTEAMVAVDVNSGRMRDENGLEETALRTNLEAAEEIARQLRLRDLGGVVVVDFIDMRDARNQKEVERAFRARLRQDRARVRPGRLGAFGIFALTRQRTGAGGLGARRPCPRCGGAGEVASADEVALRVFRELRARAAAPGRAALLARVGGEVATALAARASVVDALAEESGRGISIEPDPSLPSGGWTVQQV